MKRQIDRPITKILPQEKIETFVRAKNGDTDGLLEAGNEIVGCLSDAIVKTYFSAKNGYGEAIHPRLSVAESFKGSDGINGEKYLLYWKIKRDDKHICVPVVTFHELDDKSINAYTVDQYGNMYPTQWTDGDKSVELSLDCLDETTNKPINLLKKYGLVHSNEIAPTELKVALKIGPPVYYPDSDFKLGIKGLSYQLEMHTATHILPQYVVQDLKLLEM